ncbi:MAG TPA: SCO family protein [Limnochordales bacterium]
MKRTTKVRLGLLAALTVVVAGLGWLAWMNFGPKPEPAEAFHGFVLQPPQPAPELGLMDQHGRTFRLADSRGRAVMLFFGYTNCPDVCPATLLYYTRIKQELGPLADRVRFVFVTVDPEYDTPERLRDYINRFDPSFYGLWASPEDLQPVLDAYGIYVEKVENENSPVGYWVNHTALSFLIDPQGRLLVAYPFGVEPTDIVSDLRQIL